MVVVGLPALAQEPRPGSPDAGSAQPPSPDLAQSPASSAGARLRFDIPGQPLRTALLAFGRQAGLQVTVDAATTAGKTAQAVSGSLTAEEALTRLLAGTGLTWRYLDAGTVTLEPAAIRQDDGPMRLSPITVTARRTEELLQDVPQSVVAIDTEEIERSNIETLEDYFERAPNVAFTENGTRARNNPAIRGLSDLSFAGTSAVVGFYVDETSINPLGNNLGVDTNLLDVERIEVVYGPQGTTFGRNALGGVVNIVTKKPSPEFEAEAEGEVNSVPGGDGKFAVNGGLLPDGLLSARLSAYGEASDGFVDLSQARGSDPDSIGERSYGARLALRSQPNDRLLVDLTGSFSSYETDGLNAITFDDFQAGDFTNDSDFIGQTSLDRYRAVARVEYDFDAFTLISNTSYFDAERTEDFDADFSPLDITTLRDRTDDLTEAAQEIRFESQSFDLPLLGKTEAVFGANTSLGRSEGFFAFDFGADSPIGPAFLEASSEKEVFSLGVFSDVRIRPLEKLEINAGLRYSRDEVEQTFEQGGDAQPSVPSTTVSGNFSSLDPKVSVSYRWTEGFLTYATVSTGYRGGGFNGPDSGAPGQPIEEENAISYEAGVKSTWLDQRLLVNLAGFYTEYDDIQVATPGVFGNSFIVNAAEARSTGMEATLVAEPLDGLTLGVNYGLNFAEFTDFEDSPFGDLTGRQLPTAPRHTLSIVGEYAWPVLSGLGDAFLRAEYSYRSRFRTVLDPSQVPAGSYDKVNVRAGIRAGTLDVEAFLENALDEEYVTNGAVVGTETVAPGEPGSAGLRVRWRF